MTTRLLRTLAFALFATTLAAAQGTELWTQTKFDEFEKGTARGVAIRSDGTLELAPSLKSLVTTPSTYIWDMTSDPQGNMYVAAGAPARVYRITPAGQASIIFQPNELQVQAIVTDGRGALYAATSPDGKVYKLEQKAAVPKSATPVQTNGSAQPQTQQPENPEAAKTSVDDSWTSSVYYDPKTKYIWALEIDPQGQLYVATGDRGEIFRVNRAGQGSLFFKSDEAHIRSLALDAKGALIAGSDGSGLIYRISPAGEGFVLYSAPKKEITALAVDPSGNIYAAAVGEKRASAGGAPSIPPSFSSGSGGSMTLSSGTVSLGSASSSSTPPLSFQSLSSGASTGGGSDVYLIAPDGEPRRIWSGKDDIVYTLGFYNGQLLAGTGNRGHVFALRPNGEYTDLLKASATQITAFAPAPNGGLYCSTSNLGKVFRLAAAPESEGTYDSDVFDAHIFSKWGRAEVRGRGNFDLLARSGNVDNPDRNWSTWQRVDWRQDAPVNVPPGRFLQWRAVLHAGTPPPAVESVSVNYLSKNVAPVVDEIFIQPGARFNPPPVAAQQQQQVQIGPSPSVGPRFDMPVPAVRDRDSIAVRWTAHDDNDDQLIYSLYYRGDNESEWKLLKDKLTDKFYSWDAGLLPDGGYTIRIIASDSLSHSPQEALTGSLESPRFEVDRTPPIVGDIVARVEAGAVHLTFRAIDGFSPIKRAEFSIDAADWQYVEPVGQISDARTENYDVLLPMPRPEPQPPSATPSRGGNTGPVATNSGEHTIVVRAYDRFDNMGTAKVVFVIK